MKSELQSICHQACGRYDGVELNKDYEDQSKLFQETEGDAWFDRNGARLQSDPTVDVPLSLIEDYDIMPKRVVEIGCSNGYRLAWIQQSCGSECWGVDVSRAAIEDGIARYPNVSLRVGAAHDLPVDQSWNDSFDLVIINFVFSWIDRIWLFKTMSEVDRLLGHEGFLIIGDFYPDYQSKTRYHHLPDQLVWTYKQDYSAVFLASGLYRSVALTTSDHGASGANASAESDVRVGTHLLQKVSERRYIERALDKL